MLGILVSLWILFGMASLEVPTVSFRECNIQAPAVFKVLGRSLRRRVGLRVSQLAVGGWPSRRLEIPPPNGGEVLRESSPQLPLKFSFRRYRKNCPGMILPSKFVGGLFHRFIWNQWSPFMNQWVWILHKGFCSTLTHLLAVKTRQRATELLAHSYHWNFSCFSLVKFIDFTLRSTNIAMWNITIFNRKYIHLQVESIFPVSYVCLLEGNGIFLVPSQK